MPGLEHDSRANLRRLKTWIDELHVEVIAEEGYIYTADPIQLVIRFDELALELEKRILQVMQYCHDRKPNDPQRSYHIHARILAQENVAGLHHVSSLRAMHAWLQEVYNSDFVTQNHLRHNFTYPLVKPYHELVDEIAGRGGLSDVSHLVPGTRSARR